MKDVMKVYENGAVALNNVNVDIRKGEFVFLVGPSGAGKSTFIKMLFREVLPTSGILTVKVSKPALHMSHGIFAMLVSNWLKSCTSWICAWKNTCKC